MDASQGKDPFFKWTLRNGSTGVTKKKYNLWLHRNRRKLRSEKNQKGMEEEEAGGGAKGNQFLFLTIIERKK